MSEDHDASGGRVHRYPTTLRWAGSTGEGYAAYDRTHVVGVDAPAPDLVLSGDPAFGGRPELLNPEQLLVLAASSCQALSFLALAARARIDVVAYDDDAVGTMPERGSAPSSIETIELRPTIHVRGDAVPTDRLQRLVRLAHEECYIANSLRTDITIDASFVAAG